MGRDLFLRANSSLTQNGVRVYNDHRMKNYLTGRFFSAHIRVIVACIIVLAVCGATWYIVSNMAPTLGSYTVARGNVVEALDEPGTVTAEDKAELSFQEAGQIASVYVQEGEAVGYGAVLANLNSASLEAGVEQANAAVTAAEAQLDELQTGATPQTIAVSNAALATSEQTLANTYAGIPDTLIDAYTKANDAVRNQLADFFNNAESNPQLTFVISDISLIDGTQSARTAASASLNEWQTELANITASSPGSTLDGALQDALNYLSPIENLLDGAVTALIYETSLAATTLAAYKVSATTGLNEVNAAITEIDAAEQSIASEKAAVAQAQAGLNLTAASSTVAGRRSSNRPLSPRRRPPPLRRKSLWTMLRLWRRFPVRCRTSPRRSGK